MTTWTDNAKLLEDHADRHGFTYFPAQLEAFAKLALRTRALLSGEVGTGKTLGAISFAHLHRVRDWAVITTKNSAGQWYDECLRFGAPDFGKGGVYWYHQLLQQPDLKGLDLVVCDESHIFRNQRTLLNYAITKLTPRLRLALSATPLFDTPSDLFSSMLWVMDGEWSMKPYQSSLFTRAFAGNPSKWRQSYKKYTPNIPALTMTKSDIRADLPKVAFAPSAVAFSIRQKSDYIGLVNEMTPFQSPTKYIAALQTVCSGGPAKSKRLFALKGLEFHLSEGRSCVFISDRLDTTDVLADHLEKSHLPFSRVDSSTPTETLADQARRFNDGETKVMLMGLKSAQAVSFPEATVSMFLSYPFTPGVWVQSLGRIDRVNSLENKRHNMLYNAGSLELTILKIITQKFPDVVKFSQCDEERVIAYWNEIKHEWRQHIRGDALSNIPEVDDDYVKTETQTTIEKLKEYAY